MGFFKKLFGKSDYSAEQNAELLGENERHLDLEVDEDDDGAEKVDDSEDDIEVIVNEITLEETIELLDDVKEAQSAIPEPVHEKKSIKEIVEDVTEFIEKTEQATQECNEPEIKEVTDLIENIGIINNEVVVEHTANPHIVHGTIVFEDVVESNEDIINEDKSDVGKIADINDDNNASNDNSDLNDIETEVETEVETETNFDSESEDQAKTEHIENCEGSLEVELPVTDVEPSKKSFFTKLKEGVKKTRDSIFGNLNAVFNMFTTVDEELFEELEEALILADMGVDTSLFIINELRKQVKRKGITEVHQVKDTLIEIISEILTKDDNELVIKPQTVILVIGVNGAGKTTTIGKLTHNLMSEGLSVTVAAADTFRAAAIDQLQVWAERSNAHFIRKEEGSDPASVVFDACQSAKSRGTDVLIIDTAGRLQNKKNLMEELKKINRIIEREFEDAHKEVFLVLDSTTGQNAMQQAKLFNETADITGLVLTKLDGTAKGGVIVSIKNELNVPVRYVGLGEKINDLEKFDSKQFAKAMFE